MRASYSSFGISTYSRADLLMVNFLSILINVRTMLDPHHQNVRGDRPKNDSIIARSDSVASLPMMSQRFGSRYVGPLRQPLFDDFENSCLYAGRESLEI